MAVSDTLIGSVFDGRYRIERKLGAGGMADVYLAEDQELGRRVAIKILDDRHAHDEQFVERFRREASSAAAFFASRRKRSTNCSSFACRSFRTLIATLRPSSWSSAR